MEELLKKIADFLEVDSVDSAKKFSDYESWDSFTRLSVLAMLDSDYCVQMTYEQLEAFPTIEDFCKKVLG